MNLPWLFQLLNFKHINIKISPEDKISYAFRTFLTEQTLKGNLKCSWTKIANENADNKHPLFGQKMKMLGKIKGAPDFIFLGKNFGGAIEIKEPGQKQTKEQKWFEDWLYMYEGNYKVIYSVEEGHKTLKDWGVLLDS